MGKNSLESKVGLVFTLASGVEQVARATRIDFDANAGWLISFYRSAIKPSISGTYEDSDMDRVLNSLEELLFLPHGEWQRSTKKRKQLFEMLRVSAYQAARRFLVNCIADSQSELMNKRELPG
jgi:hypothetical protein